MTMAYHGKPVRPHGRNIPSSLWHWIRVPSTDGIRLATQVALLGTLRSLNILPETSMFRSWKFLSWKSNLFPFFGQKAYFQGLLAVRFPGEYIFSEKGEKKPRDQNFSSTFLGVPRCVQKHLKRHPMVFREKNSEWTLTGFSKDPPVVVPQNLWRN